VSGIVSLDPIRIARAMSQLMAAGMESAERNQVDRTVHRPDHASGEEPSGRRLAILTLTALGVVYGDIGTSPLYALKECFGPHHGIAPTPDHVRGVLSLIVWSLILVVTVKYIAFIMRADNRGEGGILALLALVLPARQVGASVRGMTPLIALGLIGAALLYGDGVITPAMSVLGATEGLIVVNPMMQQFVVPLSVAIIAVLFAVQRFGTDLVGKFFGPVMLMWFLTISVLGAREILLAPEVMTALNPWHGVAFMREYGWHGAAILGSVVLAVTGAEALYADMGHFGKRPIRLAWLALVFPALLINYFGQGALLLREPAAVSNPFYLLAPKGLQLPLLVLATAAAVVASQALISGAFSLARQTIALGFSPRFEIRHTSHEEAGQIYIPEVNWFLGIGTILIVLGFQSSSALGAAYGIAVTGTMAITTLLFHQVATRRWEWPAWKANLITGLFLAIDVAFLGANIIKVMDGGWVPLALAAVLFTLMATWKRGRVLVREILGRSALPTDLFLDDVSVRKIPRVSGSAVFMTSSGEGIPSVLLHHLKHNKMLHERVILLSFFTKDVPTVAEEERVSVDDLGHGFYRVRAFSGFMQSPDVRDVLPVIQATGVACRAHDTSFYLGRELLLPTGTTPLSWWRKRLFILMARNARSAAAFFNIPSNRVVELGTQIEL
jgi:KUP system potassium uptake protein